MEEIPRIRSPAGHLPSILLSHFKQYTKSKSLKIERLGENCPNQRENLKKELHLPYMDPITTIKTQETKKTTVENIQQNKQTLF